MPITGNKGEWSELYVLLELLATGKLYAANADLTRANLYSNILKIFREENRIHKRFEIPLDETRDVEIYVNNERVASISRDDLNSGKLDLLNGIVNAPSSGGAFSIAEADIIMDNLYCDRISAPSHDKKDILVELYNPLIALNQVCGFSIKSYLGQLPSLLNAGLNTNFCFEITNMNDDIMNIVNAMIDSRGHTAVGQRMQYILSSHCEVNFVRVCDDVFARNLRLLDTDLSNILAELLKANYFNGCTTCIDAIQHIFASDTMDYSEQNFYEYKLMRFMEAVALGMKPGTLWNGTEEANAGYIIVKDDGEVLAYYLYDRNTFRQYLLSNTKFEHGSASRHNFASVYKQDGHYYMNLNLQIRYIQ